MLKRRQVLLMGQSTIFTTGTQKILEQVKEIEIIGIVSTTDVTETELKQLQPDVVVLTGEDDPLIVERFLAHLLRVYPDLPVIVTNLTEDVLHIHTSQRLTARGPDLVAAIRNLPVAHNL